MRRAASFATGAATILALWWIGSIALDSPVFPGPGAVALRTLEIAPRLAAHAGASLARVIVALILSVVLAVPLGLAMGRSRRVDRVIAPTAYLLYPVPKIALLPLVFLVVGIGETARILIVVMVLFFQILVAVRDASRAIPAGYIVAFLSLGGTRRQAVRFVLLPAILPQLLTSIRIGTGTGLAVLFFAETFFTDRGLGAFIVESWMRVSYAEMLSGIVTLGLIGFVLFAAIDTVERRVCRWAHAADARTADVRTTP